MNLPPPFVSIIVVNWNGASYIEKCIQSLLDMSYSNSEIIIVDNNSSDNSVELLRRLSSVEQKLKVIVNNKNLGFARACNIGINVSKGEFIALFNSDAIADKYWLSELVTALSASQKAGAAGGPIYYCDPPNRIWFSGGKVDAITGFFWNIGQNRRNFVEDDIDTLSGCAILIRRDVLSKVGLLDEGYFLYGEDIDLSISIKRLGKSLLFVSSAISWHMVSASKKKAPRFTYKMKVASDLRVIFKNFPLEYLHSALLFRGLVLPFGETVYFYRDPTLLLVAVKEFAKNLKDLKVTIEARRRMEQIGKATLRTRFRDIIREAAKRIKERQLYW
ncbi:MAG: glycosyltransferase family 2 protein [Promethearchaeota archaeon]